ncbi:MAG TPA: sensor domain-containing diguanylate cyclase, partial [Longimicrobium sp.]
PLHTSPDAPSREMAVSADGATGLEIQALPPAELERFLQRQKAGGKLPEIDLGAQLRQILDKACELVPAECGSIFLDDPLRKVDDRASNELYAVAAFGMDDALPGRGIAAGDGIVGRVYRGGEPHLSADVHSDPVTAEPADRRLGALTRSVVAVPITIGSTVCGVIELVNRRDGSPFTERDLTLLQIFASYTSSTLQNALDAKRANELARRDDLSGLYNDRWMHVRVMEMIERADATGRECVLIFFDLDHFKQVNDSYGHLSGSQVLREIGFLLRRVLDIEEAILCRYGGDEFVVGLPDTTARDGAVVGELVRYAIEDATYLDREYGAGLPPLNLRGVITASVGVASYRPGRWTGAPYEKESFLLRDADSAMYAAKARGKNCVVCPDCEDG